MKNGMYIERYYGWEDCKVHYKDNEMYFVEYPHSHKEYYKNKEFHRLDGPAVLFPDGLKSWYINGEYIAADSQKEFEATEEYKEFIRLEELRAFE